jgi:hypothetical protein
MKNILTLSMIVVYLSFGWSDTKFINVDLKLSFIKGNHSIVLECHPMNILETNDNGYLISGMIKHPPTYTSMDGCLIKLNDNFVIDWYKKYGEHEESIDFHSSYKSDWIWDVLEIENGHFIVSGETNSFGSEGDVWIFKINPFGEIIWTKTFDLDSRYDSGSLIKEINNNYYIIFSRSDDLEYLIAIDSLGNHKWTNKFLYDDSITSNRFTINEKKSIFDGISQHPLHISEETLNDNQLKSLSSYSKYIYVRDTKDGYYFVFGYINNVYGLNIAKIDHEGNIHSIK